MLFRLAKLTTYMISLWFWFLTSFLHYISNLFLVFPLFTLNSSMFAEKSSINLYWFIVIADDVYFARTNKTVMRLNFLFFNVFWPQIVLFLHSMKYSYLLTLIKYFSFALEEHKVMQTDETSDYITKGDFGDVQVILL